MLSSNTSKKVGSNMSKKEAKDPWVLLSTHLKCHSRKPLGTQLFCLWVVDALWGDRANLRFLKLGKCIIL